MSWTSNRSDASQTLDYLEQERKKLWAKIIALEDRIEKKSSDVEREAWQSSRKVSEFRNKCESAKDEALSHLEEIKSKLNEVKSLLSNYGDLTTKISELDNKFNTLETRATSVCEEVEDKKQAIEESIQELESIFQSHPTYSQKISKLEDIATRGDEFSSKIESVYKGLSSKKKEVDDLYYEIIGYTEEDESGEETKVPGLKKELEDSYVELTTGFSALKGGWEKFSADAKSDISSLTSKWEDEYKKLFSKIEGLLPNALTAGLSHAYSKKKDDEVSQLAILSTTFKWSIFGLVVVSMIPFAISIAFIIDQKPLDEVLIKMPRLVLSILPLYIPILWVAYSSNRRMNLTKRLIEEYTHKEVLSKTFEGLSRQISSIEDANVSSDLKNRLLFNILEVSSENPGKLISDYNKADHPLMDALDKSVQLTNAVEKIGKIPGFSVLASKLDQKSRELLEEKDKKAQKGLQIIE